MPSFFSPKDEKFYLLNCTNVQKSPLVKNRLSIPDPIRVPFFRPQVVEEEIIEVNDTRRNRWLTTRPKVKAFEQEFAKALNAKFAVAVNFRAAAFHLAVKAMDLRKHEAVLIPTMTSAATAEIVL